MILPQSDPLARVRRLAKEYQRGELEQAEYTTQFQAVCDEVQQQAQPTACEHTRWKKRCKMQGIVWVRGRLLCAHHGLLARRGRL